MEQGFRRFIKTIHPCPHETGVVEHPALVAEQHKQQIRAQ